MQDDFERKLRRNRQHAKQEEKKMYPARNQAHGHGYILIKLVVNIGYVRSLIGWTLLKCVGFDYVK